MRILIWLTVGFAGVCALGAYCWGTWIGWLGIGLLMMAAAAFACRKWDKRLGILSLLLFGAALGTGCLFLHDGVYLAPARGLDGTVTYLEAECRDYSRETDYGTAVDGVIQLEGKSYSVTLYLRQGEPLAPGDRVAGEFRLRFTASGGREAATYHRGEGTFLLAYQQEDVVICAGEGGSPGYFPVRLRQYLLGILEDVFPDDTAGFAKALLLGERSGVDYSTDTAFRVSGISHIIAVSGLHVSILFSLVYLLTGRRRLVTALVGIPTVLLFAAVAGFTPSVTRAGVMQVLMMLALLMDREYDPPTALSFAVLVMLVINPMVITSISFQLSAGCMAGIFLFSGRLQQWLLGLPFWKNWKRKTLRWRLRQWLAGGVSVTLSAMFFTTPLAGWYFGSVSLVGIVTNLIALWAVTFIFYGIMTVCLLGILWTKAAAVLAWVVSWLIRYVVTAAKLLSALPLAAVYTQSVYIVLWLVLCYGLVVTFLITKGRRAHVLICCGAMGLCLALGCSWLEPLTDGCRMTVLDVGQGQCVLLQAEGRSFLVDCGGDSDTGAADLAAQTLLSQGICRLDGLIVTHYDRDHAGGVGYLLSRFPVETVFLPETEDPEELLAPILRESGGREVWVTEDLRLDFGDTALTVFAPILKGSDNESGLCVLFQRENCDILITGDLSSVGERLLLDVKPIPELTVLVAGHHGAAGSSCQDFLETVSPEYVLISAGEDNPYGHPAQEVLERLYMAGCDVYRTDQQGTIIFRR